jgi:lysozyme
MSAPNEKLRTSDAGIALIKRFESFCANLYRCPAGKPTIGYGHVILPGEQFGTITEAEAIELLRRDLAIAEAAVRRLITIPLAQSQFDALVSFTFNAGEGALERSTLRQRINQRDWPKAASELRRWVHGAGKVLPGLVTRRDEEVALLLRST